ncbi:MAG: metalloregulator ArsR/SmtB family transcription factor [Gammaproteobacteria bacterium]
MTERDFSAILEHAGEAAQLMKALSNENRLMILCSLSGGEMTVGQLNEKIPMSQSGLSQQLGILRREGLVATRRDAQSIYYTLVPGPATEMIRLLHGIYCGT